MICPKCRSEIGSQPICPYCGKTMYIPRDRQQRATVPVESIAQQATMNNAIQRISRQVSRQEVRNKLTLVFAIGTFVLQALTLLIVALR